MANDYSSTSSDQSHAQTHGSGSVVGRDQHNTQNKKNVYGGLIAVIAVVFVAVVAIMAGRAIYHIVKASELSADSTCAQFLQAPQDEELRAIRRIGPAEGVAGTGSPLALPAISYDCSGEPGARLGDVILKYKGQF